MLDLFKVAEKGQGPQFVVVVYTAAACAYTRYEVNWYEVICSLSTAAELGMVGAWCNLTSLLDCVFNAVVNWFGNLWQLQVSARVVLAVDLVAGMC
jgi:hypothetical protein